MNANSLRVDLKKVSEIPNLSGPMSQSIPDYLTLGAVCGERRLRFLWVSDPTIFLSLLAIYKDY